MRLFSALAPDADQQPIDTPTIDIPTIDIPTIDIPTIDIPKLFGVESIEAFLSNPRVFN